MVQYTGFHLRGVGVKRIRGVSGGRGLALCIGLWVAIGCSQDPAPRLGLYVQDGTLMRARKPYRAMGVNYYTCFNTLIDQPENRDFVEGFRVLREEYGIPFIRFSACSFGSKGWKLYTENPEEYFRRFDRIVREAEKRNLGLIPSLFWYVCSVADFCDEPLSELGNPDSKTRALYRKYATEMATRYKDSPAIWGWEVGNEYMLFADLPKLDHLPPNKEGSKEVRTAKDKILRPMVLGVYQDVYDAIRAVDPDRMVVTGDSLTREAAWHNHHRDAWGADSLMQWEEMFAMDTPDDFEVVSFHMYGVHDQCVSSGGEKLSLEKFAEVAVENARKRGKPVWCGELGMPGVDEQSKEMFVRMMKIIEETEIPISAIWNFLPTGTFQPEWDILPQGERGSMLEAVKELNARFATEDDGQ